MAKILVIDDSIVTAQFLENVLKEDHTVIVSNDGENVIDIIEKYRIDIVLLDIIMPKISGYEILRILQGTESTKDIPVIMITSLTSALDVKKALELGALDFVRKSSEPIEVIARVNSAVRLKHKQDMLKQNAQKDSLTQLYNRQYFNAALEKLIKGKSNYHKGISLVFMDCDFFKSINDLYGHTSGDVVLATIAGTMLKSVNSTDTVCRYGGEEFFVISPNTTAFQAYVTAERIRTNVERIPFVFLGKTVSVTISCGISHTDCHDGMSGLELVNESDTALYKAKRNGRNQTIIFSEDEKENN